jgi:LacI family transcriptional regulator
MKPAATLKKLSESLGLSISTVSRALKNHPDISEATKKRVWDLANELEYEPNTYAISLRTNTSKVFGLIIPQISSDFYDAVIASLEEEARLHEYSLLILQSSDNPLIEIANIKLCKQNRVAGIFASLSSDTKDITPFLKLVNNGIPVIFIDKVPTDDTCNKICIADEQAAKIAAEALVRNKKKNVLSLFGNQNFSITQKRLESYTYYFTQHAPNAHLQIIEAKSSIEATQKTLEAFKQPNKPDAIFCMSDEILIGTMKALQQLKLQWPTDVSVIAMSNGYSPLLYYPEISYVETSGYKLGKLAYSRMMVCLLGSSFIQHLNVDSLYVPLGSL